MKKPLPTIDILGVEYSVFVETEKENPKLIGNDGLCELYSKSIILDTSSKSDKEAFDNIEEYYHKVLRHECFHAIFAECGLDKYCRDEVLVDMLAFLYPRIEKIMKDAKKVGDEINAL